MSRIVEECAVFLSSKVSTEQMGVDPPIYAVLPLLV